MSTPTTQASAVPPGAPGGPRPRGVALFARLIIRWRWAVLLFALALAGTAAITSADVADRLSSAGWNLESSDSTRADEMLRTRFHAAPDLLLVVQAPAAVDRRDIAAAGRRLTDAIKAEKRVNHLDSYWTNRNPGQRAKDGKAATIAVFLAGDERQRTDAGKDLLERITDSHPPLRISPAGPVAVTSQVQEQSEEDMKDSELMALPITLGILLLVFGGLWAAGMPLLVGLVSVTASLAVLNVLTEYTDISIFALNMTSMFGFGLAIDYSLFVLTRYREELTAGKSTADALATTLRTAGQTVIFSALTVALCMAVLLVFPLPILYSISYAVISVAVLAALVSVVVLPAAIAVLGRRLAPGAFRRFVGRMREGGTGPVRGDGTEEASRRLGPDGRLRRCDVRLRGGGNTDRPTQSELRITMTYLRRPLPPGQASQPSQADQPARPPGTRGFFYSVTMMVMRRPLAVAAPVVVGLLLLAIPFLDVSYGLIDQSGLPPETPIHQTDKLLRDRFGQTATQPVTVVMPKADPVADRRSVNTYATYVSELDGVSRVETSSGTYDDGRLVTKPGPAAAQFSNKDGIWMRVTTDSTDLFSDANQELVASLRALPAPVPALVGGQAAALTDTKDAIGDRLPLAIGLIALVVFVLLLVFTGSVLIPIKAVVMTVLSLTATFGALVYVFQEGHLKWLVGEFNATGHVEAPMPIALFCFAFALSMDYEVFLVSRIIEEYRKTGDTTQAVARGLQHTGRVFTSAAVLLAVFLIALASSPFTPLKMMGCGLALAVILDAVVIRTLLVPAFMALAGPANWWAPRFVRVLHERFGHLEKPVRPRRSGCHRPPDLSQLDEEQLVRQLVERARSQGVELTGEGGLVQRLTQTILESAFDTSDRSARDRAAR